MKNMRKQKGFTLIELLVVIAIIGLLATLAVVSLNGARKKAKDAKVQGDLSQVAQAMEIYKVNDSGDSYPTGSTCGTASTIGASNLICSGNQFGSLMAVLPTSPLQTTTGGPYRYTATAGTNYCISGLLTTGLYYICRDGSCYSDSTTGC